MSTESRTPSDRPSISLNKKDKRRAFRLSLAVLEIDIQHHKLALEQTLVQLRTHLDALGVERPSASSAAWVHEAVSQREAVVIGLDALAPVLETCDKMQKSPDRRRPISRRLHLEDKKNKSAEVSRWVGSITAPNTTADPRIAHPDPEEDSDAETSWNPRVCFTDLTAPCDRNAWLVWVPQVWGEYCKLKAQESELKQTLTNIVATFNDLVAEGVLSEIPFTPPKYTTKFNHEELENLGGTMSNCRKLRSKVHELLPAFEW